MFLHIDLDGVAIECKESIFKCAIPLGVILIDNGIDPDWLSNHTIAQALQPIDDPMALHQICGQDHNIYTS